MMKKVVLSNLDRIELDVAIQKCNNFLLNTNSKKKPKKTPHQISTQYKKKKEHTLLRISRDLGKVENLKGKDKNERGLPYPNKYCFRLLGVVLDCHWTFEEHIKELKATAKRRLVILNRVGNTNWGLESRIMAITTHSLIESVTNYGLASFGRHLWDQDRSSVDTTILNKAARKVVGAGPTIRTEILYALADMRSMTNHYILKVANILDRTLREKGTAAESCQTTAHGTLQSREPRVPRSGAHALGNISHIQNN